MTAEFITWTPDMAKKVLETQNTHNRSISPKLVFTYAYLMKCGDWDENNLDPITINKDGVLENGQHRLSAVVKSGKDVRFFTVVNSEPTFGSFDRGRGRTTVDTININGFCGKISNSHVAIANMILPRYGMRYRNDYIVQEYIVANEENIRKAVNISGTGGHAKYIMKKASAQTAIYQALRAGYKEDELRKFAEIVNSGFYDAAEQTSAIVLRNMLLNDLRLSSCTQDKKIWTEGIVSAALIDYKNKKNRKMPYTNPNTSLFASMKAMDKGFIEAHGLGM